MRRRMLSWLLVLCMVLGMMPTAVFAEETVEITITVGDQSISAEALGSSTEEVLGGSYDCFQAEIPADTGVTITDNVTTGTQFALGSYNGALAGEAETASFTLSAEDI